MRSELPDPFAGELRLSNQHCIRWIFRGDCLRDSNKFAIARNGWKIGQEIGLKILEI
jgi:hypothetical protein